MMRRMPFSRRPLIVAGVALAAAIAGAFEAADHARGAAFVIRAAEMQGWARTFADTQVEPFREELTTVPSRHGPVRARVYRPAGSIARSLVLIPGVHAVGIEEPRLVRFARELARAGVGVVAAELDDLTRYRVTPQVTDMIEDAIHWTASRPDLSPDGRAGVMGISFAGGLGLVAAGRPLVRDRTAVAVSIGGHGDLLRVLQFLCTGKLPDGSHQAPHDYGVVVVLLNLAEHMVPPEQVEPLRDGIRTFLQASHLDMIDKARARDVFARARTLEQTLPPPARELLHYVNTRDVKALGPRLVPHLGTLGADPSLSPEKSARPAAAVYLLHGSGDNVIPAQETSRLASYMRMTRGEAEAPPVRALISPLITHAEVDQRKRARDVWNLIRFWTEVLDD